MAKFARGNMWDAYDEADLFLITTNSYIKKNGELTMGRGMALQAKTRYPDIARLFGREIEHMGYYGLLIPSLWPTVKYGAFQTKNHWRDVSIMIMILNSVDALYKWCATHRSKQVHLNFPGIGNGQLPRSMVEPIVEKLQDTVTIWEYDA